MRSAELDKGEGAVENSNEGNVDMSEGGGNADISEGGGNADISEGGGNADISEGGGNADISEGGGNADISEGGGKVDISERGEVHEPYVGLEFDSEDEARKFYFDYARRIGFVVRMMQRRISETDKKVIARRLGCNKQGFSPNYGTIGPDNKPRPSAREGCRATILVKLEKSGKWVVSRFEKEHNHPLVVTEQGPSTTPPHISGDKDKKIEFLIRELRRQDQLCAAYREKLLKFLTSIEEQTDQLSSKIQDVVDNVRKVEAEMQQQLPQHR